MKIYLIKGKAVKEINYSTLSTILHRYAIAGAYENWESNPIISVLSKNRGKNGLFRVHSIMFK